MAFTPRSNASASLPTPPAETTVCIGSTLVPESQDSPIPHSRLKLENRVTPAYMRPTLSSTKKISQATQAFLRRKSTFSPHAERYNSSSGSPLFSIPDFTSTTTRLGLDTRPLSPCSMSPCSIPSSTASPATEEETAFVYNSFIQNRSTTSPARAATVASSIALTKAHSRSSEASALDEEGIWSAPVDAVELAARLSMLPVREVGKWKWCTDGEAGLARVEEDDEMGSGNFIPPWELMRRLMGYGG